MESVLQTLHQLHCSLDIFRNGDEAKEPRKPSSLLKHCKRVLRKPKGEKVAAIISVVAEIILGQHSPSLNTHGHSDEGGEDGLQGREYFLSLNTHGHSDGGDGDGLQRSPMALGRLAMFVFSLGFRNLRGRFTWMMGPPLKLHPLSQWCFLPFWSRHPSSSCRRALHRTEGGDGLWRVATAKGH
ncbi:uncharacterized protein LOC113459057 isoform X2 [Zonotrichia albicollis]|uniref:uncharacterized protein LOC113459057 isoform X2 n=1 Tax=Zonotrichia albicollis TaxID=44394 RepID=UPI003D80E13E